MKIRIIRLTEYLKANRSFKEGDVVEVITTSTYKCDKGKQPNNCFLVQDSQGRPTTFYDYEVTLDIN